jgi:hypothetical protein
VAPNVPFPFFVAQLVDRCNDPTWCFDGSYPVNWVSLSVVTQSHKRYFGPIERQSRDPVRASAIPRFTELLRTGPPCRGPRGRLGTVIVSDRAADKLHLSPMPHLIVRERKCRPGTERPSESWLRSDFKSPSQKSRASNRLSGLSADRDSEPLAASDGR